MGYTSINSQKKCEQYGDVQNGSQCFCRLMEIKCERETLGCVLQEKSAGRVSIQQIRVDA